MTLENIWDNPILLVDTYNSSHHFLKCNQDWEISHIYNRNRGMVLYGLNEIVRKILYRKIEEEHVIQAIEVAHQMGLDPFPEDMWYSIVKEHGGRIPLWVQALPEGSWVPKGTPFAQLRNTVKGKGELVTWFEGVLLQAAFASGCATRACEMREYLIKNNCNIDRFHNFGFRGNNSRENWYWETTAWNLFLPGTDDFGSKIHTPRAPIRSIAASAHKVTQQFDDELQGCIYQIKSAHDHGQKILAMPIDTYDPDRFITEYAPKLILYAKSLGIHLVLRPDSGKTLEQAMTIYRMASNHEWKNVSTIIGESITFDRIRKELDPTLIRNGVPLNFVYYGVGAGFYKDIDRDYLGWAMKTARSNGKDRMKFSGDSIKQSIPGEVSIIPIKGGHLCVSSPDKTHDLYETVYMVSDDTRRIEVKTTTWNEIYDRVQSLVPQNNSTILAPDIIDKIEQLRKQHGL